ncbi:ABC transporter ATP-binding protein [Trichocoleus sp. FACHB-591]|uniref:ABC transporter ATP-binding protein n=1 Tax=Trichocoleus sp. FACHB-591 TaxID=2692872 RepID=UPI0016830DFA|nr:ABC transporter ATP-binding protein [Trichocoleus sp. FACHB-591]MBD2094887.1 ABC transporter ATP-binding protein [Trichocoleus sp. FACHB-591]
MSETAISVRDISKCFKQYSHPTDRLKEILLPGKSWAEEFWALRDINLEVLKGETLGIIGQNGSGKSTLLQIIAGTLTPSTGKVAVNGRISALLELGSGFNPEFTGRQNVFFNGRLLGLSYPEIEYKFDEIASFADIGDFIDQPVKTYSSGMFVRLAFAVAINVDPQILIVDEALSVGDGIFIHRCMAKIKDFQDSGGTILFVSHDTGAISRLCSKAVWINKGRLVEVGEPCNVSKHYQAWMYDQINEYQKAHECTTQGDTDDEEAKSEPIEADGISLATLTRKTLNSYTEQPYKNFENVERFGTGRAEIIGFDLLDSDNAKTGFAYPGDKVKMSVKVLAHDHIDNPLIGIMLYDRLRTPITGFNTYQYEHKVPVLSANESLIIEFHLIWPELQGGNYVLEPAIADGSQENHEMLDWLQSPLNIISGMTELTFGVFRVANLAITHQVHHCELLKEQVSSI